MGYIENFLFGYVGASYLVLWLFVLFSLYRQEKLIESGAEILVYVFAVFFLGFRDSGSGSDTAGYVDSFNRISVLNEYNFDWEPFYNFFAYVLSHITGSGGFILANVLVQLFLISIAARMFGLKSKAFVLLLYISFLPGFDMLTNGMRQGLSNGLGLIIFLFWISGDYLKKPIVLLLFTLHKSALIHIPFYLLMPLLKKVNIKLWTNWFIISFFGIIALWHFADFSKVIQSYAILITYGLETSAMTTGEKFNAYLISNKHMLSGAYKYYFLLISSVLLISIVFYRSVLKSLENYHKIEVFSLFVCFLAMPYAIIWASPFSYRFLYIFFLPGLFLLVLGIENSKKAHSLFFMVFVLLIAVLTYGSNTFESFDYR